jgi:hypothetical protein
MQFIGAYSNVSGCQDGPIVWGFDDYTIDFPALQAGDLVVCSEKADELISVSNVAGSYRILTNPLSSLTIPIPNIGAGWALAFRGDFTGPSTVSAAYSDDAVLSCWGTVKLTASIDPSASPTDLRVQIWRGFEGGALGRPPHGSTGVVTGADYNTGFIGNTCFVADGLPPCAPGHHNSWVAMSYKIGPGSVSSTFGNIGQLQDLRREFKFGSTEEEEELYGWGLIVTEE